MVEIQGKLEEYFNKTGPEDEGDFAACKYKNDDYEIWEVSESVFDRLNSYTKEEWSTYFPNSWWSTKEKKTERKYNSIKDIKARINYLENVIFFEDMADRPNQDLIETHKRELKALEIILKEAQEKGIVI